jgi:hypothetical protein
VPAIDSADKPSKKIMILPAQEQILPAKNSNKSLFHVSRPRVKIGACGGLIGLPILGGVATAKGGDRFSLTNSGGGA